MVKFLTGDAGEVSVSGRTASVWCVAGSEGGTFQLKQRTGPGGSSFDESPEIALAAYESLVCDFPADERPARAVLVFSGTTEYVVEVIV